MLDAARRAARLAQGRSRADLEQDDDLADAIMWRLTVVGEAAARVSAETQATLGAVPWPQILGMRNRLVHGYDQIRFDRVWQVLAADLAPLIAALEQALAAEGDVT